MTHASCWILSQICCIKIDCGGWNSEKYIQFKLMYTNCEIIGLQYLKMSASLLFNMLLVVRQIHLSIMKTNLQLSLH